VSARATYHCYTDGSCKPGDEAYGGWGFIIKATVKNAQTTTEGYGGAKHTLAKAMEYRAVAEALDTLPPKVTATVYSDNQSLIENLSKRLADWHESAFVNVDPHIRQDVQRIAETIETRNLAVTFAWVRAHNGNAGNERADELAKQGAREAKAKGR